jgi:ferredoxin-like protein FixX
MENSYRMVLDCSACRAACISTRNCSWTFDHFLHGSIFGEADVFDASSSCSSNVS